MFRFAMPSTSSPSISSALLRATITSAALAAWLGGCSGGTVTPDATATDGSTAASDASASDAGRLDGGNALTCRPPNGECDPRAQDCASEAGPLGCYLGVREGETAATTLCFAVGGTGGDGASCCAVNGCDRGLVCVGARQNTDGTCMQEGVCEPLCCASSDCRAGEVCAPVRADSLAGFCTALDTCDLVDQTGCDTGESCYPAGTDGARRCAPSGGAMRGESCMSLNGCASGLGCFGVATATFECVELCRIGGTGCSAAGETCRVVDAGLPSDVGLCLSAN